MSDDFDPYYQWLSIPPDEQPPHHYRLLGVKLFEANLDVIANAFDRQMAHVRTFHVGKRVAESQVLLNELCAAKICLLTPEKKAAYDKSLRSAIGAERPQVLAPNQAAKPAPRMATALVSDTRENPLTFMPSSVVSSTRRAQTEAVSVAPVDHFRCRSLRHGGLIYMRLVRARPKRRRRANGSRSESGSKHARAAHRRDSHRYAPPRRISGQSICTKTRKNRSRKADSEAVDRSCRRHCCRFNHRLTIFRRTSRSPAKRAVTASASRHNG